MALYHNAGAGKFEDVPKKPAWIRLFTPSDALLATMTMTEQPTWL